MEPEKLDAYKRRLGERIKSLRKSKGYKNSDFFAYENGFHRVQYSRYERGEDLRFTSLVRLVEAFGLTLSEFFAEGFEEFKRKEKK